jgi:hypothetical protein
MKSNFGKITSIEYSNDGQLIGIACEDDNGYIVDAEFHDLLYCFEGHRNSITSFQIEEWIEENYSDKNYDNEEQNKMTQDNFHSNYNTSKEDYSKNDYTSTSFGYTRTSVASKAVNIEDFSKMMVNDSEVQFDFRQIKRLRTCQTVKEQDNKYYDQNALDDTSSSTIYDCYTAGLDGFLGTWRIEHIYSTSATNELGYADLQSNNKELSQTIKLDLSKPNFYTILYPSEELKVFYTALSKISNGPIDLLRKFDCVIAIISKRCNNASSIGVKFYHGVAEEFNNEYNSQSGIQNTTNSENIGLSIKRTNIDSKYEQLKQTGVNVKSSLLNSEVKTGPTLMSNSIANSPKKPRGSSMSPTKKNASIAPGRTGNSLMYYNQTTTSPKKRERNQSTNKR